MDTRTLGVVGGSWRARLLVLAAHKYGVRTFVFDPAGSASCAGQIAELSVEGGFEDATKLREFASICDVIVADPKVGADALLALSDICKTVYPPPATVGILHDLLVQRSFFQANGFAVAEVHEIDSVESAFEAGRVLSYPFLIKHRMRSSGRAVAVAGEAYVDDALLAVGTHDVFAERAVPFAKSLVVTIVQGRSAEALLYPITEELNGVVLCPARISAPVQEAACRLATEAIAAVGDGSLEGVFSVKIFVLEDDSLCMGDVSLWPHRAGATGADVCGLGQYEALLRVVLGMKLPPSAEVCQNRGSLYSAVVTIRQPAEESSYAKEISRLSAGLSVGGCHPHWYGAVAGSPGDALGHITVLAGSLAELADKLKLVGVETNILSGETAAKRNARVLLVVNSRDDLPCVRGAVGLLKKAHVSFDVHIASAHLTPSRVYSLAEAAVGRGFSVVVASSRGEAHLASMIAALTPLPVIAHVIPDAASSASATVPAVSASIREGSPVGHVLSCDGTDPALLAIRILAAAGSDGIPRTAELRDFVQQLLAEKEAATLQDALRLESVGFEEFMRDITS